MRDKPLIGLILFLVVVFLISSYVVSTRDEFTENVTREEGLPAAEPAEPALAELSPEPKSDFFINFRMERKRARDEEVELLEYVLDRDDTDPATRAEATRRLLDLTSIIEKELTAESVLKAKGFEDAVVTIRPDSAVVIVKAGRIDEKEAAKAIEATSSATGLPWEKVSVMAKP